LLVAFALLAVFASLAAGALLVAVALLAAFASLGVVALLAADALLAAVAVLAGPAGPLLAAGAWLIEFFAVGSGPGTLPSLAGALPAAGIGAALPVVVSLAVGTLPGALTSLAGALLVVGLVDATLLVVAVSLDTALLGAPASLDASLFGAPVSLDVVLFAELAEAWPVAAGDRGAALGSLRVAGPDEIGAPEGEVAAAGAGVGVATAGVATVGAAATGVAAAGARPGGGTKFVARTVALASGRAASLPGRTGAVNTVDFAGSLSTRPTGIGPLRACAGGGATPGRIVSLSSPVAPAGRGVSFVPRVGGATGAAGPRMVSCSSPALGLADGRWLSPAGGVAGATGAGPTLVISRAPKMGAGRDSLLAAGRDSLRDSLLAAGRDSLRDSLLVVGRDSLLAVGRDSLLAAGLLVVERESWLEGAGRGGGPTRVISPCRGRPGARAAPPDGIGVELLESGATRLSEATG
jgi:hypothetical protein